MTQPADLLIFSELGIALVGFAGIVGAVRRRSETPLSELERFKLALLLILSGIVALLGFVPTIASSYPGVEDVWRRSITALLSLHILSWFAAIPFIRAGGGVLLRSFPDRDRYGFFFFSILGISELVLEAAVALGYLPEYARMLYIVATLTAMSTAVCAFLSLLLPVEPARDNPA